MDDELGEATLPANARRTWLFVIEALIRRFRTYKVLQEAQESVARAVKRQGEE